MTPKELRVAITALVIHMDRPPTSDNLNHALKVMSEMYDDDPEGALLVLSLPRRSLPPSKEHPENN
jgi:hypothetical protein